jgi:hypothetical protein
MTNYFESVSESEWYCTTACYTDVTMLHQKKKLGVESNTGALSVEIGYKSVFSYSVAWTRRIVYGARSKFVVSLYAVVIETCAFWAYGEKFVCQMF